MHLRQNQSVLPGLVPLLQHLFKMFLAENIADARNLDDSIRPLGKVGRLLGERGGQRRG